MPAQYWPANTRAFRTIGILCVVAGVAYPVAPKNLEVPDGLVLLIQSYPGNNPLALCRIACNQAECLTVDQSLTLVTGQAVSFNIKDAYECWVSSTIAGSLITFTAEQP